VSDVLLVVLGGGVVVAVALGGVLASDVEGVVVVIVVEDEDVVVSVELGGAEGMLGGVGAVVTVVVVELGGVVVVVEVVVSDWRWQALARSAAATMAARVMRVMWGFSCGVWGDTGGTAACKREGFRLDPRLREADYAPYGGGRKSESSRSVGSTEGCEGRRRRTMRSQSSVNAVMPAAKTSDSKWLWTAASMMLFPL